MRGFLRNPFKGQDDVCLVQSWIGKDTFQYLFKGVLAGDHGARQAIIGTFLLKFHAECLKAGIPKYWDEDNEEKVAAILNRLNFDEPKPRKKKATST